MKKAILLAANLFMLAGCSTTPDLPQGADLKEAARINTELGMDYARKGDVSLALEKLNRALSENPDYALAHSSIAYVYAMRGDAGEAESQYRKALSLTPSDPDIRNNFGVFLCAHGKADEAQRNFAEAANNLGYSTPAAAWTNAGICALRQKDVDHADNYFRTALKIDPAFPDALAQMAALTYQQQDYLRARAFIQRYETVAKPTPKTLWLGAMTETALGNAAGGRDYAMRLKRDFPASDEAANIKLPQQ